MTILSKPFEIFSSPEIQQKALGTLISYSYSILTCKMTRKKSKVNKIPVIGLKLI